VDRLGAHRLGRSISAHPHGLEVWIALILCENGDSPAANAPPAKNTAGSAATNVLKLFMMISPRY
jgi:hypothetical protein